MRAGPSADAVAWGAAAVTVRFGRLVALDGVSVPVRPGEVVAVVGGDGAGKSTLLRTLVGLVHPAGGQVRRPPRDRIGYLAATSGAYPELTVAENLQFAAVAYGVPAGAVTARAGDLLARTGLSSAAGRRAGDLSGGMRQKLGVVRAMLHEPDLLVLDEPTTGVDPVSRADVWWLIARAAARGAAVVLSTTYLDEAERAARVVVLDGGHVLVDGTPEAIVASMPGGVRVHEQHPAAGGGRWSWRRAGQWRTWEPGEPALAPDLSDAVMVAALSREARG